MKILRLALLAALALLPMNLVARPVSADPGITTEAVNVRSGPGTRYRIIDRIREGAAIDIVRCRTSWCFIIYDDGDEEGWVNKRFIAKIDVNKRKKRVYRDPTYDPFDDPFCDRFPRPYNCGSIFPTPIPFPPHHPGPPGPPPHWPAPGGGNPWPPGGGNPNWPPPKPDWPDWPDKPDWPDRPHFPGFPAPGGGGYCLPALPQCHD